MLRCAPHPINPKEKKKKNGKKKEKKKATSLGGEVGLSRFFGKKYYLSDNCRVYLNMVVEVEIFFQKCILTLQTMSAGLRKPPIFAFFFIFWV